METTRKEQLKEYWSKLEYSGYHSLMKLTLKPIKTISQILVISGMSKFPEKWRKANTTYLMRLERKI